MTYDAELDAKLMDETFSRAVEFEDERGQCEECCEEHDVLFEIAGQPYCSSECALKGTNWWDDNEGFESYLNHVRLLANILNVYEQSHKEGTHA